MQTFYYTNDDYLYVLILIYNSITIWFHFSRIISITRMDTCSQAYQLDDDDVERRLLDHIRSEAQGSEGDHDPKHELNTSWFSN